MPTYEYECTKCGELFELFQSMTEKAKRTIKTDCKECNNKAPVCRRIGTGGGVIFKGSGFYQTDYRSESYKKGAEADKPKSETKSESSSESKTSESSTTNTSKPVEKKPTPKKRGSKE